LPSRASDALSDGSEKLVLRLGDGARSRSAHARRGRLTLCVSPRSAAASAALLLHGNNGSRAQPDRGEIVARSWRPGRAASRIAAHPIVYMGMASRLPTTPRRSSHPHPHGSRGLPWARRITYHCRLVSGIERLAKGTPVNLAISLHARATRSGTGSCRQQGLRHRGAAQAARFPVAFPAHHFRVLLLEGVMTARGRAGLVRC